MLSSYKLTDSERANIQNLLAHLQDEYDIRGEELVLHAQILASALVEVRHTKSFESGWCITITYTCNQRSYAAELQCFPELQA